MPVINVEIEPRPHPYTLAPGTDTPATSVPADTAVCCNLGASAFGREPELEGRWDPHWCGTATQADEPGRTPRLHRSGWMAR